MAVAIIAEYNPFHNGHIYQINYAKQQFPGEKIVVFMSGKYVQRGELAIASFAQRKAAALAAGVDEVYEIPWQACIQAAHIFAQTAVELVAKHKIDKLLFGSETDDVDLFINIATLIYQNEASYNQVLKQYLKTGLSFPKAAALALEKLSGKAMTLPNDILGLEYVKAIVYNHYPIKPYCLKRTVGFHSLESNQQFASATLLRQMIYQGQDISDYSPMRFEQIPERIEDYYSQFQTIVINKTSEQLRTIKLVDEGIENLFKKHITAPTYNDFVAQCNSRRYTSSRIKRIMLHILLDIKK
ncbi:nucleotidyltransferase [Candidatus Mycoplasma pogonae]